MPNMDDDTASRPRDVRDLHVIALGLVTSLVFELVTVLATQDKAIRAVSPWQDDPYDAVVSLTQFAVPVLAVVIGLRLPVWSSPGGTDRARQMLRAVAVLAVLVAVTAAVEWAAVAVGERQASWTSWTWLLIAGLVVVSQLALALAVLLARTLGPGAPGRAWEHDWLGDAVLLSARVPVLRRGATGQRAAWVRRHAMLVFSAVSVSAGALEISGTVVGERWTDLLLISWATVVIEAANFAFCVISNAVAGFIARPPRSRAQRATESAVVAGSAATLTAVAFRADIWRLGSRHPLDTVAPLVMLTLGIGVAVALMTAVIVLRRSPAAPQVSNPGI